jgi:hypothetical protein
MYTQADGTTAVESILRPTDEIDSEELIDLRRTSTELREVSIWLYECYIYVFIYICIYIYIYIHMNNFIQV